MEEESADTVTFKQYTSFISRFPFLMRWIFFHIQLITIGGNRLLHQQTD